MSVLLINDRCNAMHFHMLFFTSDLGAPDSVRNELFKPKIHHRDNQETKTQNVLEWSSCLWHTNSPPPKKKKTLPCMLCSDTSFMRKRFLQLQSPTSTSSSASLPETSGVTSWVAANDLPYRLNEKREEHVLLHFPLSKTDKTCTRKYRVCLKTNSVPLDGFVKSVGSHCSHDCTAQDITH